MAAVGVLCELSGLVGPADQAQADGEGAGGAQAFRRVLIEDLVELGESLLQDLQRGPVVPEFTLAPGPVGLADQGGRVARAEDDRPPLEGFPVEVASGFEVAGQTVVECQVVGRGQGERVVVPEHLLELDEGLAVEVQRGPEQTGGPAVGGERTCGHQGVRVVFAEGGPLAFQHAFVHGQGLGVVAPGAQDGGQVEAEH